MSDPRITPDPTRITQNEPAQVVVPVLDLCRAPNGPRDRQLIYGDTVMVFNQDAGWSYIQAKKDQYCGYVKSDSLGPPSIATHSVRAAATHAYEKPDFKSSDLKSLSFGSRLHVTGQVDEFAKTEIGFIPLTHIAKVSTRQTDPAKLAALFLGTPYLWGGNSRWGIDCSGLVQAALLACGVPCPGDSDLQQTVGQAVDGPFQRNDLLFWKGHVALATDSDTLIHANAHSMSVTFESITAAVKRIRDKGDGPVTAHRRM